jgi:hypothetical protein
MTIGRIEQLTSAAVPDDWVARNIALISGNQPSKANPDTNPEQGRKFDDNKVDWDLLPIPAVKDVIGVLMFGAKKYARGNWEHVPDAKRRYYSAALRHLTSWREGERRDEESGLRHLAHAGCCVLFILALEIKDGN